jgi:AAA+ superfamily predicted ATPase
MDFYSSSFQHLMAEMERINLLIQIQVARARQTYSADDTFKGLYISEQEIDEILAQPTGLPRWATTNDPLDTSPPPTTNSLLEKLTNNIAHSKESATAYGIELRLDKLQHTFNLSAADIDIMLVCLAPELDLRHEKLYAYLQDDVTKKLPSVDLAVNLLSQTFEDKLKFRQRFSEMAPLLKNGLLHLLDDSSRPNTPLLNKFIKADNRIVDYLLESNDIDSQLIPFCKILEPQVSLDELILSSEIKSRLTYLSKNNDKIKYETIFYFQGPYGVGKKSVAKAFCQELKIRLLLFDLAQIKEREDTFYLDLQLAKREALLQEAALYLDGFDCLLDENRLNLLATLLLELEDYDNLTFIAGSTTWEPKNTLRNKSFLRVVFKRPEFSGRIKLWEKALNDEATAIPNTELEEIANKFRFSGGQIADAISSAKNIAKWRNPDTKQIGTLDLYEACRLQSNRKLITLAQKITPRYKINDIVLPQDRLRQLREICNHVNYRSLVHDHWGFNKRMSLGKGLNILFAGPSGTGKTMSAEIIANELGMELYKIDLSTVVSKYIGETEKNLARVFTEAETSNAILFFDEADALFGKRSEVRDSHDRYANLEISYLLQRMEEYDGVAILATNLRKNMDDAFVRRMQFIVEFPFPDEHYRYKIWQAHFPEEAPVADDIDWQFLSEKFKFAGGNIKNVAVGAAFFAANDSSKIGMDHIILSAKRELQKMGKLCVKSNFGKYYQLVESDE